jgi:hypothetical protein
MTNTPRIPAHIRTVLQVPSAFRHQEAGWLRLVAQLGEETSAQSLSDWLTCADAATEILRARFDRYAGLLH